MLAVGEEYLYTGVWDEPVEAGGVLLRNKDVLCCTVHNDGQAGAEFQVIAVECGRVKYTLRTLPHSTMLSIVSSRVRSTG